MIPLEDLPIQSHLVFEPCPASLALSYLRCLALAEGHMLDRGNIQQHYKNWNLGLRVDYPDRPIHPLPTDGRPFYPDLRAAINRLQFWCAPRNQQDGAAANSAVRIGDWATDGLIASVKGIDRVERLGHLVDMHDLYQLTRFADCISEADSRLLSRLDPEIEFEAMPHQEGPHSIDCEVGYLILGDTKVSTISPMVLGFYSRENEILSTCLCMARARFEHVGSGGRIRGNLHSEGIICPQNIDEHGLFMRRGDYQRTVVHVLDEILPVGGHGKLLPHPVLFTEYLSWLRIMAMMMGDDGSTVGRRRGRPVLPLDREYVEILRAPRLNQ